MSTESSARIGAAAAAAARVTEAVEKTVVGQTAAVETLLACYMAGGHALIEGVPGIAKTLLARAFASALGLKFSRVQFTPDLMPSDLLGTNVFDEKAATFRLVRGPDLHRGPDGRRDQPHAAQDAVGPARGDAGDAGRRSTASRTARRRRSS